MKTIFTLLISITLLNASPAFANTTYTVNSNETWAAAGIPSSCIGCTINIGAGYTLTLAATETCMNCVFNGGTLSLNTGVTFNIKYPGSTVDTVYFNATNLIANGTSNVAINAPVNLTNSTWTFNGTSSSVSNYNVNMSSSRINLNGNTNWIIDGGTFNMFNTSQIFVGDGTSTSTAYFLENGYTLNIYDNSYITLLGQSNYYGNWGSYNYASARTSTPTSHTTTSTINCNSGAVHSYANSCNGGRTYGPATISSTTTSSSTLALVLVTFSAEMAGNNTVDLNWSTQMESNTSHFTVERSADGISWNEIGLVAAKGISQTVSEYSFTDEKPLAGVNYYRLQMVNLDGSYGFTDVKVLRTNVVNAISFFPNPARDYVNVTLGASETETTLRLYNQAGQLLQEKKVSGGSGVIVTFAIQQYTPGIYVLNVMGADGSRENGKILIAH